MNDQLDPFYVGMIRQIAKVVGWDKLIRCCQAMAEEDRERDERLKKD